MHFFNKTEFTNKTEIYKKSSQERKWSDEWKIKKLKILIFIMNEGYKNNIGIEIFSKINFFENVKNQKISAKKNVFFIIK